MDEGPNSEDEDIIKYSGEEQDTEFMSSEYQYEYRVNEKSVIEKTLVSSVDQVDCNKRKSREDDEDVDTDGFVTVTRNKPKRLVRSTSQDNNTQNISQSESTFELCITSNDMLPKQMAFARLLREEKINNITRIRYKGAFKILIRFGNKMDAEKLINCKKIQDLGYKTHYTFETEFSYGIIKGVDLDMSEKDILDAFESSTEIIAIKRLRRNDLEGNWIDSETIRICFRSNVLPTHINVYGCRFKVDPYVFPVTQCAGCWKFGHLKRFCPTKKNICPKCGDSSHINCDTKTMKCPNCKGSHMALDRTCPHFRTEKYIRKIMSRDNVTYRKALQIIVNEHSNGNSNSEIQEDINNATSGTILDTSAPITDSLPPVTANGRKLYSDIVRSTDVHNRDRYDTDSSGTENKISSNRNKVLGKMQKKNQKKRQPIAEEQNAEIFCEENNNRFPHTIEETSRKKDRDRFEFGRFIIKIKNVFMSNESFEDKIVAVLQIVYELCSNVVVSLLSKNEMLSKIFNLFNG